VIEINSIINLQIVVKISGDHLYIR